MISVLHVGKFYPPHRGGIETYLEHLCHGLQGRVRLKVLVSNHVRGTMRHNENGFPIVRAGSLATLFSTPISPRFTREIRADHSDIVHLHAPNPIATMAYLASGHRGKLVVSWHSDIVRQRVLGKAFRFFEQRLLERSERIIVASPQYIESSISLRPYRDRCRVVPYGISVDTPVPRREKSALFSIVSVGRLVYYKGFEYLIRAMQHVDARLTIVGDGPLRSSLERLAQSLGMSDRVTLAGNVSDIAPLYRCADLFVLPSIARSEAFGIVQLEAMRAGLPVVNTSIDSGVPWVSIHNISGLTVPPRDSAALAAALNRLAGDPELRQFLGRGARARVEQLFSVEKMVESTMAIYEELENG